MSQYFNKIGYVHSSQYCLNPDFCSIAWCMNRICILRYNRTADQKEWRKYKFFSLSECWGVLNMVGIYAFLFLVILRNLTVLSWLITFQYNLTYTIKVGQKPHFKEGWRKLTFESSNLECVKACNSIVVLHALSSPQMKFVWCSEQTAQICPKDFEATLPYG